MISDFVALSLKLSVAALATASYLFLQRLLETQWTKATFLGWAATLWLVSRIGLYTLVFFGFGLPAQSDIPSYYYPQARAALQGEIPYVHFDSSYGPLFPYVTAIPTMFSASPKSIIFFSVLVEGAAILIWWKSSKIAYEESVLRRAVLLYLCNPIAIINVAIAGQNQVWISALWGLSLYLSLLKRDCLSGVCVSLSAAMVKMLGFLIAPYLWMTSRSKLAFGSGLLLTALAIALPFWLLGADLFQPARLEGNQMTSGNLPYLATAFGFNTNYHNVDRILTAFLMVTVGTLSVLLPRPQAERNAQQTFCHLTAIMLAVMLLSKKSYTNYLVIFLFPLCCVLAPLLRRKLAVVLSFSFFAVATVEPSLWFRWFPGMTLNQIVSRTPSSGWTMFMTVAFCSIEMVLVGGYVALLVVAVRSGRLPRKI